jgi:hypothetical protein
MTKGSTHRVATQGYPSGQRGWAQDPLLSASQVRILLPAPKHIILVSDLQQFSLFSSRYVLEFPIGKSFFQLIFTRNINFIS